jgi:hypothetical protein
MHEKLLAVFFNINSWTVRRARAWLRRHKYKYYYVDTTHSHVRAWQVDPGRFDPIVYDRYKRVDISEDIILAFGYVDY